LNLRRKKESFAISFFRRFFNAVALLAGWIPLFTAP